MKLFKYIIISILLHIAVLSFFLFKRGAVVTFGIRGGEISVLIGSGERGVSTGSSPDRKSLNEIRDSLKSGTSGKSGIDDHDGGGAAGGAYGAVGRLVTEAYRNNPPEYPAIARAMGYQGRVTLLLEVLPDGSCGTVDITKSSGYRVLDLAAQRAARGWIFFTENTIALSSPVRVSQDIIFMLKAY
jgi:TonB family protein